jgi:hypothetical protein
MVTSSRGARNTPSPRPLRANPSWSSPPSLHLVNIRSFTQHTLIHTTYAHSRTLLQHTTIVLYYTSMNCFVSDAPVPLRAWLHLVLRAARDPLGTELAVHASVPAPSHTTTTTLVSSHGNEMLLVYVQVIWSFVLHLYLLTGHLTVVVGPVTDDVKCALEWLLIIQQPHLHICTMRTVVELHEDFNQFSAQLTV